MSKDKTFRYLEKYVGTYRVLPELDKATNDFPRDDKGKIIKSYEDFYIPCSKGRILHSAEHGILAWLMLDRIGAAHNVLAEVKQKYPDAVTGVDDTGTDLIMLFKESYMPEVAKIVKARTSGSKIPPLSSKNLPKAKYQIPDADMKAFKDLTGRIAKDQRLKLVGKWLRDFDTVISKKKGKKFNVKEERDNSGMKQKEFIHSIGLWPDFIRYIKKCVKECTVDE